MENLSKKYLIRHEQQGQRFRYNTLGESLNNVGRSIGHRILHPFARQGQETARQEEFWALKDINFEIQQGDRVGIIGSNGAGKSTLLKILSRITQPTTGKITIKGRVASLLEVGTGFHPELTGRENIFLNGAILGMKRKEIAQKFDEIVDFAEVERFLDTPVKHYSSGMYVRLAFAVAAHLSFELLLIDEILAVGDMSFQKKCLCRTKEISQNGRTIVFVSHNMTAIQEISDTGIVIDKGAICFIGDTESATEFYINKNKSYKQSNIYDCRAIPRRNLAHKIFAEILEVELVGENNTITEGAKLRARVRIKSSVAIMSFRISMTIYNIFNSPIGSLFSTCTLDIQKNEEADFGFCLEDHNIAPGSYYCSIAIGIGDHKCELRDFDIVDDVLRFDVSSCDKDTQMAIIWPSYNWGSVLFKSVTVSKLI